MRRFFLVVALICAGTVSLEARAENRFIRCFRSALIGLGIKEPDLPKPDLSRLRLEVVGYDEPNLKIGDFADQDGKVYVFRFITQEYDPGKSGIWQTINGTVSYSMDPTINASIRNLNHPKNNRMLIFRFNVNDLYYEPGFGSYSKATTSFTGGPNRYAPLTRETTVKELGSFQEVAAPLSAAPEAVASIPEDEWRKLLQSHLISSFQKSGDPTPKPVLPDGIRCTSAIVDHTGLLREALERFRFGKK